VSAARLKHAGAELSASLAVLAVSLLAGFIIIAAAGYPPGKTISALWNGAFVGSQSIDATLQTMIPLVLAALGWIIAFRAGRINVGLEGQILAGGITATVVGLYVHAPAAVELPLAVLAGMCGGAVYAGIAAALWAWRGVNEIIATFMLNLIAALIVTWLVNGPLQEPTHEQPQSAPLHSSALFPHFFGQTSLSWDIVLAPVLVIALAGVLHGTTAGFRLRMTGDNVAAARHVGVSVVKVGAAALIVSGALAGLAGASLILGARGGSMLDGFSSNFGFDGIAVALLARNSPVGCIPAALLFAALQSGGGLAETQVGINTSLIGLIFGLVVILAAGSAFLVQRRWRLPHVSGMARRPTRLGVGP
jgi:simple sugar transport system permease protein